MHDLVIVGGGAAGLFAAYTAAEAGVRNIVVLESLRSTGGNSAMAGGYLYAPETSGTTDRDGAVDRELGEALFFHHYDLVEPGLLRRWLEETKNTIALMESWGFAFRRSHLGEGHTLVMADSPGVNWFHKVLRPLTARLEAGGVTFLRNTTARAVEKDADGRVCAVRAETDEGKTLRAEGRCVLLACGGFLTDRELLRRYFPMYYAEDSFYRVMPAPGNGIALAKSAGALLNEDCTLVKESGMCFRPEPDAPGRIFAMDGSVFVNRQGKRFVDESLWHQNYSANALLRQPGKTAFALYSRETLAGVMDAEEPFNFRADRERYLRYIAESAARREECGYFDTLAEAAAWIGAEPEALRQTVEEYNGFCETGRDRAFLKPARFLRPLRSGPYLVVRIRPMYVDTIGPVVVDERLRVLGQDYRPIPGLYAAGVIAAGWMGRDYMRFGSALSFSTTSGRMAGQTIAAELML